MSDSDGENSFCGSEEECEESELSTYEDVSDESSHDDGEDAVYFSSSEDEDLQVLLGGSSSRKRTIENYIAPEKMRDTVQRCVEYPRGIYIDRSGRMCPDDPRSGRYGKRSRDDDDVDEDDAFHEVSRRHKKSDGDSDDEWYGETDTSDSDEYEEEEEDEGPAKKKRRGIVEEEWKDDRDSDLTDEQKKQRFMDELHSAMERTREVEDQMKRSRKQVINAQNLNDQLGVYVEEWETSVKRDARGISLKYDSKFVTDTPSCHLKFVAKRSEPPLFEARMNCSTKLLECPCNQTFDSMRGLYSHLVDSHATRA